MHGLKVIPTQSDTCIVGGMQPSGSPVKLPHIEVNSIPNANKSTTPKHLHKEKGGHGGNHGLGLGEADTGGSLEEAGGGNIVGIRWNDEPIPFLMRRNEEFFSIRKVIEKCGDADKDNHMGGYAAFSTSPQSQLTPSRSHHAATPPPPPPPSPASSDYQPTPPMICSSTTTPQQTPTLSPDIQETTTTGSCLVTDVPFPKFTQQPAASTSQINVPITLPNQSRTPHTYNSFYESSDQMKHQSSMSREDIFYELPLSPPFPSQSQQHYKSSTEFLTQRNNRFVGSREALDRSSPINVATSQKANVTDQSHPDQAQLFNTFRNQCPSPSCSIESNFSSASSYTPPPNTPCPTTLSTQCKHTGIRSPLALETISKPNASAQSAQTDSKDNDIALPTASGPYCSQTSSSTLTMNPYDHVSTIRSQNEENLIIKDSMVDGVFTEEHTRLYSPDSIINLCLQNPALQQTSNEDGDLSLDVGFDEDGTSQTIPLDLTLTRTSSTIVNGASLTSVGPPIPTCQQGSSSFNKTGLTSMRVLAAYATYEQLITTKGNICYFCKAPQKNKSTWISHLIHAHVDKCLLEFKRPHVSYQAYEKMCKSAMKQQKKKMGEKQVKDAKRLDGLPAPKKRKTNKKALGKGTQKRKIQYWKCTRCTFKTYNAQLINSHALTKHKDRLKIILRSVQGFM